MQAELAKKGLLDLDVPTVTGKTLGENIKGAHILNCLLYTSGMTARLPRAWARSTASCNGDFCMLFMERCGLKVQIFFNDSQAVSYTHLDVYKRQE